MSGPVSEEHLGPEFRAAFRGWRDLWEYVAGRARFPAYGPQRALQQLVAADLTARLPGVRAGEWVLFGSLSLPCRVPTGWRWGPGAPVTPGIDQAYVMPRTAFDLDLCAVGIAAAGPSDAEGQAEHYGAGVVKALHGLTGPGRPGLGGLVRYEPDLRVLPNGQVMGVIRAVPIGGSPARQVDDPVVVEIDVKPTAKVTWRGEPQEPTRPFLGIPVPGLSAPLLPLQPSEDVFAAKALPADRTPDQPARQPTRALAPVQGPGRPVLHDPRRPAAGRPVAGRGRRELELRPDGPRRAAGAVPALRRRHPPRRRPHHDRAGDPVGRGLPAAADSTPAAGPVSAVRADERGARRLPRLHGRRPARRVLESWAVGGRGHPGLAGR